MLTDQEKAAARVGKMIANKYQLRRVLGVGGMGAVYEAVHGFTSKHCAVKVIDKSIAQNEGYAARFLREARAAAEIGHPGICDVLDAGEAEDGSLYLVLELLEGEDLGVAIKRRDLRVPEIIELAQQLLAALEAAHARGIVHRDIKPENIFLTRNDRGELKVKLLDFGVAKHTRRQDRLQTQAGTVIGTPYYMSPEQACGDEVDPRADIWAAGAVLYHALAFRPPYEAPTYHLLVLKIIDGPPRALQETRPDLPDWLCRVVDHALAHDKNKRWPSARGMADALTAGASGSGKMDLDWEQHEDSTMRTHSPFEDSVDSLPPPVAAGLLTPRTTPQREHYIVPPNDENLASTVEASPSARTPQPGGITPGMETPQPGGTPQAWESPASPTVHVLTTQPRTSPLVIAILIGGALLLSVAAIGAGVLVAHLLEPAAAAPVGTPRLPPAQPDSGLGFVPR